VLADAGVASRRKCEELIEQGRVEVNGEVVPGLPAWADPARDRILVNGRPIRKEAEKPVYVLLNKPPRTLTAASDEPGSDRRTVVDLVEHPSGARLFPVGRLDYDTVGLLILTNDGELANRLTHPRFGVPKTYRAKVGGVISDEAIAELERGIYLAERKAGRTEGGARTSHVELAVVHRERDATVVDITLREGRNRQVRRMLAAVDLPVKKLERTGMGPVVLRGVARGAWRDLTLAEVRALRKAAAAPEAEGKGGKVSRKKPASKTSVSTKAGGKKLSRRQAAAAKTPGERGAAAKKKASMSDGSGSKGGPDRPKKKGQGAAPPEPPAGKPVRRRTIKNAINRAARDGRAPG